MTDSKEPTHTAFALKRANKRQFISVEIGKGRQEANGAFHAYLDRLPIGGFSGYVQFVPIGKEPPEPQRPDNSGEEEEEI